MAKKVIGLDNLKVVKSYIDRVRGEVSSELDAATKDYLDKQLEKASEAIYKDYDSKYKELTDRIAYVEQYGNEEELKALQLQLDALVHNTNDKFNALDSLETEIGKLNGDYDNLYDGITTGKIFSAGQLDEIIKTAMITETTITDDMVSTPNVFTSKIVALIGNFGSVKAANIAAGTIAGSSIESTNTIAVAPNPNKVAEGEPVWKIDNEGNGWLAKGNIHWDAAGNVTFGPGVKLSWESVDGGTDAIKDITKDYEKDILDYVNNFVADNLNGAASLEELQAAREAADKAVDDLNVLLSGKIEDNKEEVDAAFDAVNNWITVDYENDQLETKNYYDGVAAALEQAIADGNTELAEQLKKLKEELEWKMNKNYEEFQIQTQTINNLKGEMQDLQHSAVTKYNMEDLLRASLIETTEIGPNQVSTPSLLAKKIVGLTGTFGYLNASKIVGTMIQGYTMSSPTEIKDAAGNIVYSDALEYELDDKGNPVQATDEDGNLLYDWTDPDRPVPVYKCVQEIGPDGEPRAKKVPAELPKEDVAWQLNHDGSGHVAERQIIWDYPRKGNDIYGEIDYPEDKITDEQKRYWRRENVKVSLGDGVQIQWVTNALNKIGSKLADWAADGKMSPIEQKELLDLYNEYTEEYNRLCTQYNNYVTISCPFPENLKSDFDGAYNNLTSAVKHHTRGIYDWSTNTPLVEDAVIEDYSKYDDKLKTIDIDKDDAGNAIAANKKLENVKKFVTARETFADGVAKAYSDWKSERTTKENLHKWAKDGVLSPLEQKDLYNTYLADKKEYEDLVAACETIEKNASERADKTVQISYKSEFDSAWSKYVSTLKYHTSGVYTWSGNTATKIESEDIINPINIEYNDANKKWSNITNYYGIKSKFITEINAELSDAISIEAGINLKHSLQDWAADGKLSPIEQKELIVVFDEIVEEYAKIVSDITSYNDMGAGITDAEKNAYKSATDNAKAAIKHHTRGVYNWSGDKHSAKVSLTGVDTDSITVNENASASQKYENINEYYVARQVLINIINKKLAQASINTADANRKKAMNDWAADGKLSPIEQKDLKKTYEGFIKEKTQISTDIQNLKNAGGTLKTAKGAVDNSSETEFNTAYAAMVKAVKHHTGGVYTWSSDTSASDKGTDNYTTVEILTSGDSAYSNINTYLEKKQKVISALANGTARLAGSAAESAAATNLQKAEESIAGDLEAAEKRIANAMETGDMSALAGAEGAKSLAKNASEGLDALKTALYGNNDMGGNYDASVLSSGDLYNLSRAAIAKEVTQKDGELSAQSVIAQNIVGLAGTFAKITAEQITSTEITGKTIKSTDGTWEINRDGSGKLANGKITFNSSGLQIDGQSVMTGIKSNPAAEEEFGKLAASYAKIDNLDVTKLNTTGEGVYGAGTISIEDNEIKVYNKNSANEVLRITGSELNTVPSSHVDDMCPNGAVEFNYTVDNVYNFVKNTDNGGLAECKIMLLENTIEVPDNGYDYYIKPTSKSGASITFITYNFNNNMLNLYVPFWFLYVILDKDTELDDELLDSLRTYGYMASDMNSTYFTSPDSDGYGGYNYYQHSIVNYGNMDYSNPTPHEIPYAYVNKYKTISIIRKDDSYSPTIDPGTYKVYAILGSRLTYDIENIKNNTVSAAFSIYPADVRVFPADITRCDISSYGFRYIVNETKKVEFTKTGTFLIQNGNNIFAVDNEGIGFSTNGSLSNVKRLKTLEFKFRTDKDEGASSNGKMWNKITVLSLGDPIGIDSGD